MIHYGVHAVVERLPSEALRNDVTSWSEVLCWGNPQFVATIPPNRSWQNDGAMNNVPPYGRSGLYSKLQNLQDFVREYRETHDASFQVS